MRRPIHWLASLAAGAAPVVASVGALAGPQLQDPLVLFRSLVERYRGLSEYSDSVTLERRTVEASVRDGGLEAPDPGGKVGEHLDCHVQGSTLAVTSSSVAHSGALDSRDASLPSQLRLANHIWSLPHLALRFADEPLRSMDGAGGSLVPTKVDEVLVEGKSYLRLHLARPEPKPEPDHEATPGANATVDLFVNPRSMLVERIEHRRTIAEGIEYEATINITPERAVEDVEAKKAMNADGAPPQPNAEPAPMTDEPQQSETPAQSAPPPTPGLPAIG